jgi:hypothetical protein
MQPFEPVKHRHQKGCAGAKNLSEDLQLNLHFLLTTSTMSGSCIGKKERVIHVKKA